MNSKLKDKICLITGATSGIGFHTAVGLAQRGVKIVFTSFTTEEGNKTKAEIIKLSGNPAVEAIQCDLGSFASIKNCCNVFLSKYSKLHILINNAAVLVRKRTLTVDGIEKTFAINYLAVFLMTMLLKNTLIQSAPSRIINVTSRSFKIGRINFSDIEMKNGYRGINAYTQSKLALNLFTKTTAEQLEGTGVTVNCVHPGRVNTNIINSLNPLVQYFVRLTMMRPERGAEPLLYLAASETLNGISGAYFDRKIRKNTGKITNEKEISERLWKLSGQYSRL